MAVEKSRVVARIRALFPKTNLAQKRMDALSDRLSQIPADDADDASIDQAINDFNETISFEDLAKMDDRARALEAKAKKDAEDKKKGKKASSSTEDEEDEEIDADTPAWAKALIKQNKILAEKVEAVEAGKVADTKLSQAREVFGKSEVLKSMKPEIAQKWINRFDLESETSFEDQIKELETEYTELVQANADAQELGGPAGGGQPAKVSQTEVDEVVDSMKI